MALLELDRGFQASKVIQSLVDKSRKVNAERSQRNQMRLHVIYRQLVSIDCLAVVMVTGS